MKILFICGGLEPGKDGVGDYTRRLAGELIKQGVQVGIMALNDKFIVQESLEHQVSEGVNIPCFRIPQTFKTNKRVELAKKWVDLNNPEWLSLQFVIYSFNDKGLPFGIAKDLKKIGGNKKWHIMFHELWLGLKTNDPFKYAIIGRLQISIVKSIRRNLNIKVVHTHTQFYSRELKKLQFKPSYLPIFSNIPIKQNKSLIALPKSNKVSFVVFGSIHPKVPLKQFAQELSNYFKINKKIKCNLIILGKSGLELKAWVNEFENLGIEVIVLGERNTEDISIVLQESSYGITTNPIFVVEKSGTVAAMREHNLPVLVVAENTSPKEKIELQFDSDIFEYKSGNFTEFMNRKKTDVRLSGLNKISIEFLNSLTVN